MANFSKLCTLAAACALALCGSGLVHAQIRIGQTTGLTGPVAASVKDINVGAKLYLDSVNASGGINGQRIVLISMDDKFEVPLAVANAKKLIADESIVALFLNRGTPHAQALLPLLEEGRIPLIAPSTGAMALHNPVNPWVFNVRATYQLEAEKLTRQLGMSGLDQVAVLYVNDSFGEDATLGTLKVFKEAGKTPALYEAIDRVKPDYTAVVQKILAIRPVNIIIIGSVGSVSEGIKALRAAGSKANIATLSNNASAGFVKLLGDNAPGIIVSQVFPSERRASLPMITEAVSLANTHKIGQLTPAMIEGFAAAKVLVAGLKRAAKEGKGVSRATLVRALETFSRVDIGGLEVSFSPTDHTGLGFADVSIIGSNGTFRR
jgi:ABC-type branched-subunit amino acid transport system substrate-binding protein